ncbi:MAG: hypothetical protein IJD46_01045 [Bacilli bacterium]|nr:hypothetical protein [Bacilli bacterium]
MTNNGAVNTSIGVGGSYTIPAGYHNGSGKVSGPALSGNATTGAVLSGYTFYSNSGTKQTGTMTNRGALTLTTSNISNGAILIPAGYHNGSGTVGIKTSLTSFSGDLLIRSYGNSSTPIGVFRNGTSGSYTYSGSQYPYIIRLAEGTTYDTCLILCYIGKDYVI